MFFASDNAGPVHPNVMAALADANNGYALAYGGDALTAQVQDQIRDLFEAPQASVHLVATGTAANALILATLAQPWQTIFCSRHAHIQEDECNAPEFYSAGAKLTLIDGDDAKITPDGLKSAILAEETRGVHGPQRGPVSLTQVTERGTVYNLEDMRLLTALAHSYDLPVHLDGARFANALVTLGCSPAEMTWKSGIDALSFGGTKNGLMGVEAVVFFDPKQAWEFELRRKRGAHLFSKNRYLAAQMQAYLTDALWLDCARAANRAAKRLAEGLNRIDGVTFNHPPEANLLFASWSRAGHRRLNAAGAQYYIPDAALVDGPMDENIPCRLVCDWSASDTNTDRFFDLLKG